MKYFLISILLIHSTLVAQELYKPVREDSLKGSITDERAWWDVQHYAIEFELDPLGRSINGKNSITFKILNEAHTPLMQIDLQEPLQIDSVKLDGRHLTFKQFGFAHIVNVPNSGPINSGPMEKRLEVYYSGKPKLSTNPPYDGGFSWARDSLDRHWVSVSCQLVGGSVWYPCKEFYGDEPDRGASLTITIPDSLGVIIGNGRLRSKQQVTPAKSRYTWEVVNPINIYGLSFYVGHYVNIKDQYTGEKGPLDLDFWVLDYNHHKAISHMAPEVKKTLSALEKWWGPYPFYEDGFKMVESSYIGMEHQSAIAYGNKFKMGRVSFGNLIDLDLQTDRLIVHETAHEWYGNNITMADMADRWVQEGFAAYGEEMFIEELLGREAGREFFVKRQRKFIKNKLPLVSEYGIFKDAGPDMYFKGWAIIHMLREIVNDDVKFRNCLRAMNEQFYHKAVYSADLEKFFSQYLRLDLNEFFDQYLRQASVPILQYKMEGRKLHYRLHADVKGLALPLKLKSPDVRIVADQEWRVLRMKQKLEDVSLDPNYLVEVKATGE